MTVYNGLKGNANLQSTFQFTGNNRHQVQQYSFMEIDYEIFSTVILSLLLIQEEQLSVSGKRLCINIS